jgi:4-cresol dehydrogenase (hydroxylating)
VYVPRHDDVHAFVDVLCYLTNSGICDSTIQFDSPMITAAAKDAAVAAIVNRRGGAAPSDWDRIAAERGLMSWGTKFHFYGPQKVIDARWEYVRERFGVIPGVKFTEGSAHRFPLTREQVEQVDPADKVSLGIPNLQIFAFGARTQDNPSPTSGHLWFSPVVPMSGEGLLTARRVFHDAFAEWDVAPLGSGLPYSFHARTFLFLYGFQVTTDPAVNRRNRDTFRRMIQLAAEHGWGEYRTHPAFMEPVTDAYSFNNHALRRLHESLKDAIDPNGIISAGRYGIWPRHLRQRRT